VECVEGGLHVNPLLIQLRERAKSLKRRIIFPESEDSRTLKAGRILSESGWVEPVLIGNPPIIRQKMSTLGIPPLSVEIMDVSDSRFQKRAIPVLLERQRSRGLTDEEATTLLQDPLWAASASVELGMVHGIVAGAVHTTAQTVRAYLKTFGIAKGLKTVSSFFFMLLPETDFGQEGVLIYSDAGVVPDPTAEQMAEIAQCAAESFQLLVQHDPLLAFLSFSTKGSANSPSVLKVREGLSIFQTRCPHILSDGELQADAALIPQVAKRKAPDSPVAGRANVLIFPNLDAGNIAYKLTQRLAGATALGPILQGLNQAGNDLSRGCSENDIVNVAVITALQSHP